MEKDGVLACSDIGDRLARFASEPVECNTPLLRAHTVTASAKVEEASVQMQSRLRSARSMGGKAMATVSVVVDGVRDGWPRDTQQRAHIRCSEHTLFAAIRFLFAANSLCYSPLFAL